MASPGATCLFDPEWTALRGPVFGLAQPAIIGGATARLPEFFDFRVLDEAMDEQVGEPVPALPADAGTAYALLFRVLHWTGAVQRRHKIPVASRFHLERSHVRASPAGDAERFVLAMPYVAQEAASASINWVRSCVLSFLARGGLAADEAQLNQQREALRRRLAPFVEPGINTFRFLRAADGAGIPVTPIAPGLHAFGLGRRSRWLYSSLLDTTSAIGAMIARDKFTCASILRDSGLPAPTHFRVANQDQAVDAAHRLGYPVVVKPADRDQGVGVVAGLTDDAGVGAAFAAAREFSDAILVEKHVEGNDYRIVVLDGTVVQAFGRRPGGVMGDGRHSVAELIDIHLRDEGARRRERDFGRRLLTLDEEAIELLRARGMAPDTVVPADQFVALRRRANVSTGGLPIYFKPADIHPDNAALAIHAAAALRMDLVGVDLIMADLARSWLETGALICEVNAMPQLSMTGSPAVYADILRALLGPDHSAPVWLHLSTQTPASPPRLPAGAAIGYASARGIWIGDERWAPPQPDGFTAARMLLRQRPIDAAIVHLTPDDIMRDGLPFGRCRRVIIEADCLDRRDALARLLPHADEVVAATGIEGLPSGTLMTVRQEPGRALEEILAKPEAPDGD